MQRTTGGSFDPRLTFRKALGTGFLGLFILALLIGLSGLLILIIQVLIEASLAQLDTRVQLPVPLPRASGCPGPPYRQPVANGAHGGFSRSPWVSGRRSTWRNTLPRTA